MRSILLIACAGCLLLTGPLQAHVPHDVATAIALSPDYPADPLLFGSFSLIDTKVFGRSTDAGFEWHEIGSPMTQYGVSEFAMSPAFGSDGTAFAATQGGGVYRTQDRGLSWTRVGLAGLDVVDVAVSPAFASNGLVLCATTVGLQRSDDGGETWAAVTSGLTETNLASVTFTSDDPAGLIAFTGAMTVHRSDDGGNTWVPLETFSDRIVEIASSPTYAVDGRVAMGFRLTGVSLSDDQGATWTASNAGLTDLLALDVVFAPTGELFVSTRNDGVFRADGFGQAFALHMTGVEPPDSTTNAHYRQILVSPQFAVDGTVYLACTEGIFVSHDGGFTWEQYDIFHQRIEPRIVISPDFAHDGEVYVTDNGGGVFLWKEPRGDSPGQRSGGPLATTQAAAGKPAPPGNPGPPGAQVPSVTPTLDEGSWEARSNGLNTLYPDGLSASPGFAEDGTLFYGFTGIYRTNDRGRTWTKLVNPVDVSRDLAVSTNFPNDSQVMIGSNGTGLFLTHDAGDTWEDVTVGLPPAFRSRRIVFSPSYAVDDTIFIASWDDGVYVSHDGAATWSPANVGLTDMSLQSMAASPGYSHDGTLLAGTRGSGLFRTTDGGASWTQVTDGFDLSHLLVVSGVAFSPDFVHDRTAWVVTLDGKVYRSTDGGESFTEVGEGFSETAARDVAASPDFVNDRTVFVSSHEGLWRSRDAGAHFTHLQTWTRVDDTHYDIVPTGSWMQVNLDGTTGKGVSGSTMAGDARRFRFLGDRLEWHVMAAPDAGLAEVWIDDVLEQTVDLYAPTDSFLSAFTRTWSSVGLHEVRIVATGLANPLASDARVFDDGFTVSR
ncbi:MAG: hypothetical protein H6825_12580 [Planctomycetes bacterium]|nr:hypothetical protein [Planctomycetota bacterium]